MSQGSPGSGLTARLAADLATLDAELAEIDLLISQATAESERHEQKRKAAGDKLAGAQASGEPPAGLVDQAVALVTLSRRAALMEAQVDVLTGKRKVLARYRDAIAGYREEIPAGLLDAGSEAGPVAQDRAAAPSVAPPPAVPPAAAVAAGHSNRVVLAAQEELRREIARAMHDGPAQSLTNIVLQAQIVERMVERDPAVARDEVRQLVAMVQRTLDATKSFISDVRPMVLDDLGLVPTLRGAARDRGRRAGLTVGFESFGADRRLPTDMESGLFRLLDDALEAYLALRPDQISLRLDWSDQLEARVTATRNEGRADADAATVGAAQPPRVKAPDDLPPALAAMMAQRRDDELAAAEQARRAREIVLPAEAWDEIRTRAESLGIAAELLDGGATIAVSVDLARLGAAVPTR